MLVDAATGRVEGRRVGDGGVVAFRGIRYGRLATGSRFDPVAPPAGDASQDLRPLAAVFPQLPGRLGALMGRAVEEHPQEEDAFLLNVWAPEGASGLPVFVFLHGGAFVTGGGTVRWYDGARLAAEANMVVVTVNYRLGPLAHLVTDDARDPNRSVGDVLEALRWVRTNIAHLGGDPSAITLGGQSAGGYYTLATAVLPEVREMLRGLFVMSSPGLPPATHEENERISKAVVAALGGADPRIAPVEDLLVAHRQVASQSAAFGRLGGGLRPTAVGPVADWLDDPVAVAGRLTATELLVTHTRDEHSAFFFAGPERHVAREQLRDVLGDGVDAYPTDADPYEILVAATSEQRFAQPARDLVSAASAAGVHATLREFTVRSPMPGVGSTHCLDLPYLFGNREDWFDAPMLEGIDTVEFERESAALRAALTDLVHGESRSRVEG